MTATLPGNAPRLAGLSDYVRHYAGATPDREAIVFGANRLTWRDLDGAVSRCAAALGASGAKAGDRIAMLTTPRPEFAIVLLAAQRLGAIWVGLNPRYRLAEMEYILGDCAPVILFAVENDAAGRDYAAELDAIRRARPSLAIVTIGECGTFDSFLARGGAAVDHPSAADDPTIIVYTSGTTGKPKGALLAHRNLIYCYESVSRSFAGREHLRENLRVLCNLPPNHIGCISEMLGNALIRGGTTVFQERFNPAEMLAGIAKERITLFGGVPVMLQALFDHPDFARADLSSVRMIGWGGAPMPRALAQRMLDTGAHLFTNYGLTEGGAVVSATPPDCDLDILCDTVGMPDASANHRLVDDTGADVPPGESGEIWLRGDGVFLRYWNDPDASQRALPLDGWLRTGDIAWARADGMWVLDGRKSEMFKSGGFNVYPREIEIALEQCAGVALAAVVSVRDDRYFEVGVAFVQRAPGSPCDADAILHRLRQELANYKVPKLLVVRDALPMLPIGKLDKPDLRTQAQSLWRSAGGR